MSVWRPDERRLADLAQFALIELDSRDVEPWADLIRELYAGGALDTEEAAWVVALYNTYDSLGSAWQVFRRWPTPARWAAAEDRESARAYPCTQERRNLRGGRVLRRHQAYAELIAGVDDGCQLSWLMEPLIQGDPQASFAALTEHMRGVWGVGRQSAFEWAEFAGKVLGLNVTAGDAQLWESEGPRRSLQRLYGNPAPTREWLDRAANECRNYLTDRLGYQLPWEDFETIICDFNVMRDGRYYPGRHLAALKEEILLDVPTIEQPALLKAFDAITPPAWRRIQPGINKRLLPIYRQTGQMVMTP